MPVLQDAVYPVADAHPVFRRLKVDIGGPCWIASSMIRFKTLTTGACGWIVQQVVYFHLGVSQSFLGIV